MGAHSAGRVVETMRPADERRSGDQPRLPLGRRRRRHRSLAPRQATRSASWPTTRSTALRRHAPPRRPPGRGAARRARVLVIGVYRPGLAAGAGARQRCDRSATACDSPWAPSASAEPLLAEHTVAAGSAAASSRTSTACWRRARQRLATPTGCSWSTTTCASRARFLDRFVGALRALRARPGAARPDAAQPLGLEGHAPAARVARARDALRRDRAGHRVSAARAAAELLPFPELRFGWGLDLHWAALAGAARLAPRRGRRPAGAPRVADRRRRLRARGRARRGGRASWPTAPTSRARAPATRSPCTGAGADATAVRLPRHAHRRRRASLGHADPAARRARGRGRVVCLSGEGAALRRRSPAPACRPTACDLRGRADPRGWRRARSRPRPRPDAVVTRGVSGQLAGEAIARRARAPTRGQRAHAAHRRRRAARDAPPPAPPDAPGGAARGRRHRGGTAAGRAACPARLPPRAHRGDRQRACSRRDVRGPPERVARARRGRVRACSAWRACGRRSGWICSSGDRGGAALPARDPRLRRRRGSERAAVEALAEASGVALLGARGDVSALLAARGRALPPERGRGAAHEHPRGDGARAAGGGHRRRRHRRRGGARRDRPAGRARRRRRDRAGAARAGGRPGAGAPDGRGRPRAPARALHAARRWSTATRRAFEEAARPSARPDILLLSLGTTLGWRVADDLPRAARAGGRKHGAVCGTASGRRRPAAPRLPGQRPGRDGRRAARGAQRRRPPPPARCRVSSTTAAMLLPTRAGCPTRSASTPPRASTARARGTPSLHALERRAHAPRPPRAPVQRGRRRGAAARRGARRWSCRRRSIRRRASCRLPSASASRSPTCPTRRRRDSTSLCGGWAAAAASGRPARGVRSSSPSGRARTCAAAACAEPDDARAARDRARRGVPRARCARAHAYVGGARWEDWGQAPLEALADGALLATVPSGGPYEAPAAGAPARPRAGRGERSTPPRWHRRSARPSSCRTSACAPTASEPRELLRALPLGRGPARP